MDKGIMERFVAQSTVPFKKKDDRIYDCVWRAHRDVLVGQNNLEFYMSCSHKMVVFLSNCIKENKSEYGQVEFGAIQKLVNLSLKYLLVLKEYESLEIKIDEKNCDCPLDSHIFAELKKEAKARKDICKESEIKLINSLIKEEFKWTRKEFTDIQYTEIQKFISTLPEATGGNIYFDFKRWK